jgi:hypothetical protein
MQESKNDESLLSRRGFLTGAAIATAGVAVAGLTACDDGAPQGGSDAQTQGDIPTEWDNEADIVIAGAGIVGLVAAVRARDLGASVIVVEANYCAGGHSLVSGGHTHLGGGHSLQKRMGVEDSADKYYIDHTEPFASQEGRTVTKTRDRANIREVVRGAANVHAASFEFLLENGWKHLADSTLRKDRTDSVPRTITSDKTGWEYTYPLGESRNSQGLGLTRPIEKSARDKGVKFYMNHHMDKIYRDSSTGNVVGIEASYSPRIMPGETEPLVDNEDFLVNNIDSTETVRIKANKAVVVATGGSSSNWEFHSIFDPRYGPEHSDGVGGDPFSYQDGSGEIAVIEVGGTIGGTEVGLNVKRATAIGTQYGYKRNTIGPGAGVWPLVRSLGFDLEEEDTTEDGIIYVNMLGNRFFAEDVPSGEDPVAEDFFDALFSSVIVEDGGEVKRLAGPVWAIFDDEWAKENDWDVTGPPSVDYDGGYFYKGDTLEELAGTIVNKFYEQHKMPPENLVATVERYNSFVDTGQDLDFGRRNVNVKIGTPPFYAAWCANCCHDTLIGVLINGKFQCLDIRREVIPHLYAGGECSAGQGMHGHGKNVSNGYAIGTNVVDEPSI